MPDDMPFAIENKTIAVFRQMLAAAKHVLILSHMHPDGDAVGSSLGLTHLLHRHCPHLDVATLLPNDCPASYLFLEGSDRLLSGESHPAACREAFGRADLIIGVDFNNTPRVGCLQELLTASQAAKVLIDHHPQPETGEFDLVCSHPELSSASELVYWVARAAWGEGCLDVASARCLYAGISSDTGSFAFSNERPSVYEAAAHMVALPIQAADIYNRTFNNYSVSRMQFFAFCLNERMRIFAQQHFAYIYISMADQARFGTHDADTEGFVNAVMKMDQIQVGALVKEQPDRIRISLRSKQDFDVNAYARKHFEGGGHVKAAGATSYKSLTETVEYLEQTMLSELA